jgi:hypothetical protein
MSARGPIGVWVVIAWLKTTAVGAAEPAMLYLPEDEEIRLALEAGPEHLRDGATVYVFGKSGYRKVRSGTNGFTCLVNRDGNQTGDNDVKPTCWDPEGTRTLVPVMLRVGELMAQSMSAEVIRADIDAGFASGKFSTPAKVGIAYMLLGDLAFDPAAQRLTRTSYPPHYMIYSPGLSSSDIGVDGRPQDTRFVLPSVYAGYSGGERTAYIIVPAPPRVPGDGHNH